MARILVFTPTYDNLLRSETVESVAALAFDGEVDRVVSDENPYPGRDMRNCNFQFQKGRRLALDGGYDGLLLVEHDMIVPADGLQKLWETPAAVVYGAYMLRHGMHCLNLFQNLGRGAIGMSLSLYPRELTAMRRRGWGDVSGVGFGCLLIRAGVLGDVPFRNTESAPDLPFAHDCATRGIRQVGRTDVECGHIVETGITLWPFRGGGTGMLARVYALQDVVVVDGGQTVQMKRGRYYSLSVAVGLELVRAGYVRIAGGEGDQAAMETAIDPHMQSREKAVLPMTPVNPKVADWTQVAGISTEIAQALVERGFVAESDVVGADDEALLAVSGLGKRRLKALRTFAEEWS